MRHTFQYFPWLLAGLILGASQTVGAQTDSCTYNRTVFPAGTELPDRGVSIREAVLIGPRAPQPRSVQYAVTRSNRVISISVTHLVAET